jgi:16S rRNA (guanine527-N7)-methyltransferase
MTVEEVCIAGQNVSRETLQRLEEYEALVRHWTPAINLISKASIPTIWNRHIADSAQIFPLCPASASRWLDVGSGAGFPGLVVAILAKESRPDLEITLVEADARKATFLRHAAGRLGLSVDVVTDRIENLAPAQSDVVSARALAALPELLFIANHHLAPGGIAIFPKGARHAEEVAAARQGWSFDLESRASLSEPDAAILIIRNIKRAKQD